MVGDGIVNIFSEDSDINVIKSWLVGSTLGQTYSLSDRFLPRIKSPEVDINFSDAEWNDIIGYKYDYKIGDPELEKEANRMLNDINDFIDRINSNPEKYSNNEKSKPYSIKVSAVIDNVITGFFKTEDEAKSWAGSRARILLADKCLDGVDGEWNWDGNINIEEIEKG